MNGEILFSFLFGKVVLWTYLCLVLLATLVAVAIDMSRACLVEVLCTLDISIAAAFL